MQNIAPTLFLQPGELFFGKGVELIHTVLGSCVALSLWHPGEYFAGLAHIVLPQSYSSAKWGDARYVKGALNSFKTQLERAHTSAGDYKVGIYGGGSMFPGILTHQCIGKSNIERLQSLLPEFGFSLNHSDCGGNYYRRLTLNPTNGEVLVTKKSVMQGKEATNFNFCEPGKRTQI